jgi:hypothetical protein
LEKLGFSDEDRKAIEDAVSEIVEAVTNDPNNPDKSRAGDPFPHDHHESWKKRIPLPGSNMGKRGGLRLAYWWHRQSHEVRLLRLYYKRDQADLMQKHIDAAKERFK